METRGQAQTRKKRVGKKPASSKGISYAFIDETNHRRDGNAERTFKKHSKKI